MSLIISNNLFTALYLASGYTSEILDPSSDQTVDEAILPKGRELPMLILFDSGKQQSLKKVMQLTINTFVREEESLMIATNHHKDELEGELAKQCQIVPSRSLSGIESQWMILVADSLWTYEKLSRARNGLVILMDISAENWYVFLCCCHVSCAYSYCFS